MNTDQLVDSLSENDPNPATVLSLMNSKRRAARQRMYAASGGLAAVVVAIVAGVLLQGVNFGGSSSSSASGVAAGAPVAGSSPALTPAALLPYAQNGTAGSGSAASCAAVSLKEQLVMAVHNGASVIVGYGTVGVLSSAEGFTYEQVTLRSAQTLAGPEIRSGSTAWVQVSAASSSAASSSSASSSSASSSSASGSAGTSSAGNSVTPEGQSLWAPGGELFGIVTPAAKGSTPGGPVLRLAPVVSGQVIFSPDECWNVAGLPARPYHGKVSQLPLGVPLSSGASPPKAAPAPSNLSAVPLADVEKVVPKG